MSLAQEIQKQYEQTETVERLTSAFENIATTNIRKIKDRTISSKEFFLHLWHIYQHLRRIPTGNNSAPRQSMFAKKEKEAVVLVSSPGKLSGEIDHRIVEAVLGEVNPDNADIIAVGMHGDLLMRERGVKPAKTFQIPEPKGYLSDVSEIIDFIKQYPKTTVYYETYVSLPEQEIKKIELLLAVRELSQGEPQDTTLIYPKNYIFEPTYGEMLEYMESIMLKIALSQIFMESNLAQQASRFKAMHQAEDKAGEIKEELGLKYHRAKRADKDLRSKETIYSMLMNNDQ